MRFWVSEKLIKFYRESGSDESFILRKSTESPQIDFLSENLNLNFPPRLDALRGDKIMDDNKSESQNSDRRLSLKADKVAMNSCLVLIAVMKP